MLSDQVLCDVVWKPKQTNVDKSLFTSPFTVKQYMEMCLYLPSPYLLVKI